ELKFCRKIKRFFGIVQQLQPLLLDLVDLILDVHQFKDVGAQVFKVAGIERERSVLFHQDSFPQGGGRESTAVAYIGKDALGIHNAEGIGKKRRSLAEQPLDIL